MGGHPQRGRPITGVPQAARMLGRDVRTVRRMIESGELEGGATLADKRRQWFVYADQPLLQVQARSPAVGPDHGEIAALRAENADLRARAMAAEEGERLLLAGQATLRDALRESQSTLAAVMAANESMLRGADGYRIAADGYRGAADEFRQGAAGYVEVVKQAQATIGLLENVLERYSDTISQHITPGHPGALSI